MLKSLCALSVIGMSLSGCGSNPPTMLSFPMPPAECLVTCQPPPRPEAHRQQWEIDVLLSAHECLTLHNACVAWHAQDPAIR